MRIEIPVSLGTGESLNTTCVKLVADSSSAGAPQIVTARVSLDQIGNASRLVITTRTAINEPAMRLNIKAGCGSFVQRDYVLLFDPAFIEPSTQVASTEPEKPVWLRQPRQTSEVAATPRQTSEVVASKSHPHTEVAALPKSTWGTPVATGPVTAPAAPALVVAKLVEPKAAVPSMPPAPEAAPREMMTLVSNSGGGFITEAGASSLTPRVTSTPVVPPASARSLPLLSAQSTRPQSAASQSVWIQMAPYAAIVFGAIILTLVAFMLQRRSAMPMWMSPAARRPMTGETQAGAQQVTFAHFGAMTEPAANAPRSPLDVNSVSKRAKIAKPIKDETIAVSELDTLLQDIQSDIIDERTIKDAWKAAAADSGIDMGCDSILKAIAAAERDLQIGTPEPSQVALDSSLDNELLTVPNVPKGIRFG
ncbi:MAG: hypothetical protein ABI537_12895 [Casimicrobiaceae bacterium]